eukprot:CAMPEP_0183368370 /NCGR_PEP_ID=MMETSP0164_2-20130417/95664_1 /TAXON_ID=221442 /ORGANISM="Coccolithus pelagicus ssp braarudi, Strain PLY182g" /LENGTH=72 /DNA_ID=CAMNT_0025544449 /DNA_START=1 /DNA_END=215 /DNA_ORIENTATION=-
MGIDDDEKDGKNSKIGELKQKIEKLEATETEARKIYEKALSKYEQTKDGDDKTIAAKRETLWTTAREDLQSA